MTEQFNLEEFSESETQEEVPNQEWEERVFSDVIEINNYPSLEKGVKQTHVGMRQIKENVRKIQETVEKEYSYSKPRFENGDTLFARITPCLENGKTAFVDVLDEDEAATGSTEFLVLSATEETLPKFVYYTARRPDVRQFAIKRMTGTSGRQRVPTDVFGDLVIEVPPLEEQRRIVDFLDALDSRIESNERVIELCNEISQSIFKHWFIDFAPFEDQEMVYRDEIGMEIPRNWDINQMEEVAKIVDCLHSKKPEEVDSGKFYIEVKDIGENGELHLDDKYLISEEDYEEWTRRITAKPGDVIISKDGRVGAVAQIPEGIEGAIGRNIVCIRPDQEELSSPLLREYMLSPLMKQEIGKKTLSRSIFETLHVSEIEDLRVVIPPQQVREKFDEVVRPFHKKIEHGIKESITLGETRDLLVPKLMRGEFRLRPENN